MTCYNHPNAPTIETCSRCEKELCGMCANFFDVGVYCEKCARAVESERFVMAKADLFKKGESRPSTMVETPPEPVRKPRDTRDRGIIWLGVGGSASMIFFSLILYAYPSMFEFDPDLAAARLKAQALEDCRLVFEEIGYMLSRNQIPDPALRCPESSLPNIVTRNGDLVRVSHPNPAAHGLREIYVTNQSHEVVLEEYSQP